MAVYTENKKLGTGQLTKTFTNSYLYNKVSDKYEKGLVDFLMKAEEIDKSNAAFDDIRYEVKKRQVSASLVRVLDSDKVKLMKNTMSLPKAFKVFMAKDIKGDKTNKVFIDVDIIRKNDSGQYTCSNPDILVAYLVSAMNQVIYYGDPKRLIMADGIIKNGASAFAKLFTNIVDYLYKISINGNSRNKLLYLSSMYYISCILKKDFTDSMKNLCRKISGLSEREEELLLIQFDDEKGCLNINFFIQEVSKILRISKLTLDAFLEKWIYLYGTGTQFALELYPAFATMMTNAYVGCYLNNQKTIEKIVGKEMVDFSNTVLRIGAESI